MNKNADTEKLTAALEILQRWQCSPEEIQQLIGENPMLEKIYLILDIDQALKHTFSNKENSDGFIRMKNWNSTFNGRSPLQYMLMEGIDGMTHSLKVIRNMTNY